MALGMAAVHRSAVARLWIVLPMIIAVGCTRGGQSRRADDTASAALPLLQWVVGQWQITAENGTGPQLTISFDSATATTLYGHVMRFMSGNMGVGPGEFRPFTVNTPPDESIEVIIEMVDAQPSTNIQLELQRTTDDLEVRTFRLGTQDMTANNRVWIARRLN